MHMFAKANYNTCNNLCAILDVAEYLPEAFHPQATLKPFYTS